MKFPDDYPHISKEEMDHLVTKIDEESYYLSCLLGERAFETLLSLMPSKHTSAGYQQIVADQEKSWTI